MIGNGHAANTRSAEVETIASISQSTHPIPKRTVSEVFCAVKTSLTFVYDSGGLPNHSAATNTLPQYTTSDIVLQQ